MRCLAERAAQQLERELLELAGRGELHVRLWSMHDVQPRNVGDMQSSPFAEVR